MVFNSSMSVGVWYTSPNSVKKYPTLIFSASFNLPSIVFLSIFAHSSDDKGSPPNDNKGQ